MTDPHPAPPDAASGDRRPLQPGGGAHLRRSYLVLLLVSAGGLGLVVSVPVHAAVLELNQGNTPVILLVGCAAVLGSSVCLITAALLARAAVHGDTALVSSTKRVLALARLGKLIGWFGAPVVAGLGILGHYQGVEFALIEGLLLGVMALLPAFFNQSVQRLAQLITG